MMWRAPGEGARRLAALICVVILAANAPLAAGGDDEAGEGGHAADAATTTQHIAWSTSDLTGDFAVRLEMQFSSLTLCTLLVAGTGPYRPYDLLLYLGRDADGGGSAAVIGGGATVLNAAALNTQFHLTPNLYWLAAIEGTFSALPGTQAWIFAGFGLQPLGVSHPITDYPFELQVTCDKPFTLARTAAAREAFGATHANLEQGIGVRLAPAGTGSSVNANAADGVTRTTTGDNSLVIAKAHGGLGGGLLVHLHPNGVEPVPFTDPSQLRYRHSGPAGAQTLQWNQATAPGTDLYAMILGLRDVGGIAGLDTWPGLPTY